MESSKLLCLDEKECQQLKDCALLFLGTGVGSVIAEVALRFGFERFTFIDTQKVKNCHLNSENYTENDIGKLKVEAIKERLKAINGKAIVHCYNCDLTAENLSALIQEHQIVVNTLSLAVSLSLAIDENCQKQQIPVLYPKSFAWGSLVTIVMPNGLSIASISKNEKSFDELRLLEYVSGYLKFWNKPQKWIDEIINLHKSDANLSFTQFSMASWTLGAMCTQLLYNLVTSRHVRHFPKFYLSERFDN